MSNESELHLRGHEIPRSQLEVNRRQGLPSLKYLPRINLGVTSQRQEKQKGSEPVNVRFFKEASVTEISNLFDFLISQAQEEHPSAGTYGLFKAVVDKLPKKIPSEVQQKSFQGIASMDTNTRKLGEKAILLLNAKTILSVVDLYFMEGIDTEEDREEMMASAIVCTLESLYSIKPHITVSQQIHGSAKVGILEFIGQRDNMPIAWIRKPANRQLIAARIKDSFAEGTERLSDEKIKDLAEELSRETGINVERLFDYLKYVKLLNENFRENVDVNQDETVNEAVRSKLKDDVGKVLQTLTDREKRVFNLRFGLEDGVEQGLEEVGKEFGVTDERIRQIEAKALWKMGYPPRSKRLRDYLDGDYGNVRPIKYKEPQSSARIESRWEENLDYLPNLYSIEWFNVPEHVKKQLVSSGIRQIGDFFSAAPSELLEGWTGNPQHLIWTVKGVLDNLGVGEDSRAESDIRLLYHITNGILYKEERSSRLDVSARKALYRKGYEELSSFFSKSKDAQNK